MADSLTKIELSPTRRRRNVKGVLLDKGVRDNHGVFTAIDTDSVFRLNKPIRFKKVSDITKVEIAKLAPVIANTTGKRYILAEHNGGAAIKFAEDATEAEKLGQLGEVLQQTRMIEVGADEVAQAAKREAWAKYMAAGAFIMAALGLVLALGLGLLLWQEFQAGKNELPGSVAIGLTWLGR